MTVRALTTAALGLLIFSSSARAQLITRPLLVGNQGSFNALDLYEGDTGVYHGGFAGSGTGPPGYVSFDYGPNGNLFIRPNASPSQILQYNGITGVFVNTFVPTSGGNFTFGPDGNLYRIQGSTGSQSIARYNGQTGQFVDNFISGTINSGRVLRFGPGGDLFVADDVAIRRFNGTTGADLGTFTQPGAGGGGSIFDFLFTPDGRLLLSPGTDEVLQFNGSTGAFIGVLAQGNGLNVPYGLAIGPDSNLYVASTNGNSIKRFDLITGAFLGDLVASTAHSAPSFIGFSPNPLPEPGSCLLVSLGLGVWSFRRAIRRRWAQASSS